MTFGQYIKLKRNKKGLNQSSLASLCKVSQGYICKVENDAHLPNIDVGVRMLMKLGCNLDVLKSFWLEKDNAS